MVIEGLFGELVNLETTYLGMLAFSGAATHMTRIVQAAAGVPVIDMAARHYPYEIIEQSAYAAAIGGAVGTSTAAGHRYVMRWLGTGNGEHILVVTEPELPPLEGVPVVVEENRHRRDARAVVRSLGSVEQVVGILRDEFQRSQHREDRQQDQ